MRGLFPNALVPKFLLSFVPMLLVLAGGGFWWLLHYDSQLALGELTARVGNHAARAVAALERHAAVADPLLARDLLAPLTADRAVVCIDLERATLPGTTAPGRTGTECEAWHHEGQVLELPVADGQGTTLTVRFSDAEVTRQASVRRNALLSTLVTAIAIAAFCAFVGLRLVVGRRLASLSAALQRIGNGGERLSVDAGSDDELGRVMQAFNQMIRREAERERELEESLEERKAAHAQLERLNSELEHWIRTGESERRFRDFVASASDWYWEMDDQLRFSYFSDRFAEVTGVPAEALLGKTREETGIPNVDANAWQGHLDDLRCHRPFRSFEHPRTKSDGTVVWLAISGTPLFDEGGKFRGYRGTGQDITQRVRAKDLAAEKEVTERLARTKDEFLANMSHEIRTPINGVLGMTEVLLRTRLDLKQRRYAVNVRRSAEMLLGVVNDILDFSKMEAGKLTLHEAPFDLRELFEDVVEMFAPAAQDKGLELLADVPTTLPAGFRADAGRLRQVLTNLVGNAVKFTHEGEVVLKVSCDEPDVPTPLLHFEVTDTGIGIAPEAQAHVFESFAQADGTTARNYGGTGLGLAISSQLVALMGSTIELDSAPLRGSTFRFSLSLPRDAGLEATVAGADALVCASEARSPLDGHFGVRVLLAEDNTVNQEVVLALLEPLGVEVEVACDGQAAVQAWYHGRHEVVLMDCQMPKLNGFDAARRIRQIEREHGLNAVPVIALTANALHGDRERCLAAGMTDYLSKPFSEGQLREVIERWLLSGAHQCAAPSASAPPQTANDGGKSGEDLDLDPSVLERYRNPRCPGRRDVLSRIVEAFLEQSREQVEALEAAAAKSDVEGVCAAAHALKSSSAQVGARRLSRLSAEMERTARSGSLEGVVEALHALRELYPRVREALAGQGREEAA